MAVFASIASAADTLTCDKPAGTAEGDVLVAVTATVSTPTSLAGWDSAAQTDQGGIYLEVFTRIAGPSEPASYTFASTALDAGIAIIRVSGGDGPDAVDGTPTTNNTSTLTKTCASITTTLDNALLIMAAFTGSGDGCTVDPAMVDRLQLSVVGGAGAIVIATEELSAAGATGSRTFTRGANPQIPLAAMLAISGGHQPPPPPRVIVKHRSGPTVLISDAAGFGTQRVPVNGVSRSWVVGGSGSLSAEVQSADLVTYGLNRDLRGHWIVVEDDDAGPWGGVIGNYQPSGDGTIEIAANDWTVLFEKRRMPRRSRPLYGPPGTLALVAIAETVRQHGTPVVDRHADDIDLPVSLELNGGDLRDALDSMADETGQEWWIPTDPATYGPGAFRWGIQGLDLTGTVQLIEGRHIADWRAPTSDEPVVNDLEAYPLNDRHQMRQTIRVENAASIAAIGRRQGSAAIPGGSHGVHIRNRAIGLVNELAQLGDVIEMDVLNEDQAFRWFREGDLICVLLPSVSEQLTARVMARSLDDARVMSVSADVLTRRSLS